MYDAAVIGGGFYGAAIAVHLSEAWKFERVALFERESRLLTRASFNNQARVHNGYHYPRSYATAFSSRANLPRFIGEHELAVRRDFTSLYAVAKHNSKVSARQFRRFCREIGAPVEPASQSARGLFEPKLIDDVFVVEEFAFDAVKLAEGARAKLANCGVDLRLATDVTSLRAAGERNEIEYKRKDGPAKRAAARRVFNCTYSRVGQFAAGGRQAAALKHEIAEIALLDPPACLSGFGITIIAGPFFSLVPFPARGLHALTHVRYTPHLHWIDRDDIDPYGKLELYPRESRVERMIRDAARYVPALVEAHYAESLFEVKTVPGRNEIDDGRPILVQRSAELPNCISILGGKIDNIYDVLAALGDDPVRFH